MEEVVFMHEEAGYRQTFVQTNFSNVHTNNLYTNWGREDKWSMYIAPNGFKWGISISPVEFYVLLLDHPRL